MEALFQETDPAIVKVFIKFLLHHESYNSWIRYKNEIFIERKKRGIEDIMNKNPYYFLTGSFECYNESLYNLQESWQTIVREFYQKEIDKIFTEIGRRLESVFPDTITRKFENNRLVAISIPKTNDFSIVQYVIDSGIYDQTKIQIYKKNNEEIYIKP